MITYQASAKHRASTIKRDFAATTKAKKRVKELKLALAGKNGALTNTVYEVIGYFSPQLVFQNPDINVESTVPGEPKYESLGLEYALDALAEQQSWAKLWSQATVDALAWKGVIMVTTEKTFAPRYAHGREIVTWDGSKMTVEEDDKFDQPTMVYIDAHDFFTDSGVKRNEEARHMGHRWQEDHARLKAKAKASPDDWDVTAVEAMSPDSAGLVWLGQMFVPGVLDDEAKQSHEASNLAAKENHTALQLDLPEGEEPTELEVEGAEDRKYHTGTIYTWAGKEGGKDIRKPRLYRGPSCGPYVAFEGIQVPFSRERAPHLATVFPQIDNAARIDSGVLDAIDDQTTALFGTKEVMAALKKGPNNGLYEVGIAAEALQQSIVAHTVGGVTDQLMAAQQIGADSRDRTANISGTMNGAVTADTTATAETLADQSTDIRLGLIRNSVYEAVELCLFIAGWHVEHAPGSLTPVKEEVITKGFEMLREMGMDLPEGVEKSAALEGFAYYTGGNALKAESRHAFDAKTIKITPMSMERVSEGLQQKRALQAFDFTLRLLEAGANFPGLDIKGIAEDFGMTFNIPGLGKHLPDKAEAPEGQAEAQGQPQQPQEAGMPGRQSGANSAIQ